MLKEQKTNIILFSLVFILGVFSLNLTLELDSFGGRLMPLVVTVVMMGLALVKIALELKQKHPAPAEAAEALNLEDKETAGGFWQKNRFLWALPLAGLAVGTYCFGFYLSILVFVGAYIRLNGGSLKESLIFSLSTPLVIYVVFNRLLQIDMYPGIVFDSFIQ